MPIYEYYCTSCGHEFEVMQKITDRPIKKCEACGKLKAKRAISKTSFVLKGSGWYVTDYGGAKPSSSGKDTSSKDSSSDASTDKKSKDSSSGHETPKAANA
jgi:putative FmdB family regulatory protein